MIIYFRNWICIAKTTGLSAIASNISAERTFPAESPKKTSAPL
jgi:hypothetical protein